MKCNFNCFVQIVDKKFWPWLNTWSRHLAIAGNQDENKNGEFTYYAFSFVHL